MTKDFSFLLAKQTKKSEAPVTPTLRLSLFELSRLEAETNATQNHDGGNLTIPKVFCFV